jgi:hypothetical protein
MFQLNACERGNILIVHTEENWFNSYIRLGEPNQWLEISWRPCNYPQLNIQTIEVTDEKLAAHIRKEFANDLWVAAKMNLEGVTLDENSHILDEDCGYGFRDEEDDD